MSDVKISRQMVWKLYLLMAKEKIRTVTELQRRLRAVGYNISTTQLARNVYERPQRINAEFLDALLTVFECDINDLMGVETVDAGSEETQGESGSPKASGDEGRPKTINAKAPAVSSAIAGPKAIPFPVAGRK